MWFLVDIGDFTATTVETGEGLIELTASAAAEIGYGASSVNFQGREVAVTLNDIDSFDPVNPGGHPCATVEPGCVPISVFP